jgi:hypothetical protein
LIEELHLSASSRIQALNYGIDWDVRMVAGVGNHVVCLADASQYP